MLYILNTTNKVNNFSEASMRVALESNIDFHIAGNWGYTNSQEREEDAERFGITIHQIDFIRNPLHYENFKAYKQLVDLVQREQYDVIHCNTPIGGVCGRLVGKKCKIKKIIYQAHGFHFYKGAPLINKLIYYPVERWLAHFTDVLITINQEDYEAAQKFRLRNNGKVYFVHGVGMDTAQYKSEATDRVLKRKELGLSGDDIALISMGDLVLRKNYSVAVKAIAKANNPRLQYFICGKGPELENLRRIADEQGVSEQIHFLGFRTDIKELLKAADIFLFTTLQEGLPRSMMEAMASGLPCIASKIRGNIDLIEEGANGLLYAPNDADGFASGVNMLANSADVRSQMGINNIKKILNYDISEVTSELQAIYNKEIICEGRGN